MISYLSTKFWMNQINNSIIISMIKLYRRLKGSKVANYLRYIGEQLQNQRLNRECIGQDRDGNKYYQYYSYYGLPTRRQIRFKIPGDWDMRDLVYYRWLHKTQFDPPTQSQKQQFYLQEKQRYELALEWDQKEGLLMEQFRKKREELLLRNQALRELEEERKKNTELNITSKRQNNT